MALSYGNEEELLAVLDDNRQGELLKQWHTYRDAMRGTDPRRRRAWTMGR